METKEKQSRVRQTVYLKPELDLWIRQKALLERQQQGHYVELSDIINDAIQSYQQKGRNQFHA